MFFSKPMEGDIHTGLPGSAGAEPLANLEEATEEINRMEPVDSTLVCNSTILLPQYKDWVLEYLGS
jgi:hypothetical protein